MTTSEDRKHISEYVKNYCTALAIVIGGIWALIKFGALLEVEQARVDLERAHAALELDRLEIDVYRRAKFRDLQAEAVLQIGIEATASPSKGGFVVLGRVLIENVSDLRTEISLAPNTSLIGLTRIMPVGGQVVSANPQIYRPRAHSGPIDRLVSLPSRTLSLPFVFWVDQAGIYQITFEAEVRVGGSIADEEFLRSIGLAELVWQEVALIRVEAP